MAAWGWACQTRLVKQNKLKPTQRRSTKWDDTEEPGPADYPAPEIFGGRGFSRIKRAPAYTFGQYTPVGPQKQASKPNAPLFNISGLTRTGKSTIPQVVISTRLNPPKDKTIIPGPGAHYPKNEAYLKNPPKYSIHDAYKPPYEAEDMWTCPPNMYWPPIPGKKPPVFSFGDAYKRNDDNKLPGPCDYDKKFEPREKAQPKYSFGLRYKVPKENYTVPAPNEYSQKRAMFSKRCNPAISFGIKHSPYLGIRTAHEMPSRLELLARDLQ